MAKIAAVVPAAGSGSRMGAQGKKQYLPLAGVPVLGHVLKVMEESSSIEEVVVVVGPGEEGFCRSAILEKLGVKKVTAIVAGGKERQDSVYSGLLALSPDTGIVVIHDGARPLLSLAMLDEVVAAAKAHGAATCAVPVKDTVKSSAGEDGFVTGTFPRGQLWLAQTPQAFSYSLILEAHRRAREENIYATDDAGLVEYLGLPVKIVPGAYKNIKITTPEDLIVALSFINAGRQEGN